MCLLLKGYLSCQGPFQVQQQIIRNCMCVIATRGSVSGLCETCERNLVSAAALRPGLCVPCPVMTAAGTFVSSWSNRGLQPPAPGVGVLSETSEGLCAGSWSRVTGHSLCTWYWLLVVASVFAPNCVCAGFPCVFAGKSLTGAAGEWVKP